MRSGHLLLVFLSTVGCVRFEHGFSDELSSIGVTNVNAHTDRGRVEYRGQAEEVFNIYGTSWGTGATRAPAENNEDTNVRFWEIEGDTLFVDGDTQVRRAGVDFEIHGPDVMNVVADVDWGSVHLEDVEGTHVVRANRISSERLIGDVSFTADGDGMDVELWPWYGGTITLDSWGDVDLQLPYGGGYDIEVWGDPEYHLQIADLGWDEEVIGAGYYAAHRWPADIRIDVFVSDGHFELRESR